MFPGGVVAPGPDPSTAGRRSPQKGQSTGFWLRSSLLQTIRPVSGSGTASRAIYASVTAIRAAGADGNPDTEADPNWLPEVGNTTPDPSYPGAHAVISAAGAEVLISFFHTDHLEFSVTSEVMPGVERSFTSFSAAAEEATLSRIFAGVHFLFDLTTGQRLGSDIADFIVDNFLTSRDRDA